MYSGCGLLVFDSLTVSNNQGSRMPGVKSKSSLHRAEVLRVVGVIADQIEQGTLFNAGIFSREKLACFVREAVKAMADMEPLIALQRVEQWSESDGPVLWWRLPVVEPPFAGTPLDSDWPGYHTHWTRIPNPSI